MNTVQNQIIDLIGNDVIREGIVKEINKSKWFAILSDEASNGTDQFMSIVLRFVDEDLNIREEFVGFLEVERTTADYLFNKIRTYLSDLGLDMKNLRGQGYDGASNMSGEYTYVIHF